MAVTGPYLCFLPKVVPFGEMSVYRSDPRHVAKLTSRSDGLDVVSTARKRRWGETISSPSRRMRGWLEMAKIPHFLIIVVKLSSETSHSTFNSTNNGRALH